MSIGLSFSDMGSWGVEFMIGLHILKFVFSIVCLPHGFYFDINLNNTGKTEWASAKYIYSVVELELDLWTETWV